MRQSWAGLGSVCGRRRRDMIADRRCKVATRNIQNFKWKKRSGEERVNKKSSLNCCAAFYLISLIIAPCSLAVARGTHKNLYRWWCAIAQTVKFKLENISIIFLFVATANNMFFAQASTRALRERFVGWVICVSRLFLRFIVWEFMSFNSRRWKLSHS